MNQKRNISIDNKPVPVSLKLLWAIFCGVVLCIFTISGFYYRILMSIDHITTVINYQDKDINKLDDRVKKLEYKAISTSYSEIDTTDVTAGCSVADRIGTLPRCRLNMKYVDLAIGLNRP